MLVHTVYMHGALKRLMLRRGFYLQETTLFYLSQHLKRFRTFTLLVASTRYIPTCIPVTFGPHVFCCSYPVFPLSPYLGVELLGHGLCAHSLAACLHVLQPLLYLSTWFLARPRLPVHSSEWVSVMIESPSCLLLCSLVFGILGFHRFTTRCNAAGV